jgi:NADH-ubiquinone oxidoreductase chain 5
MAAPTPISALVHSSTLVTAGLYLIIRYSFIFYSSYKLIQLLLIVSLFTSFYAGTSVLVESDLKKVIALSTLSHLGFIGIAFSLGLSQLAFFHLLRHALFKSLLFIRIGDIIVNLIHSQDRRYISNVFVSIPYSTNLIRLRLLNLLGLPNIRGFYSKDLILEFFLLSSNSLYLYVILICNLVFTFYYTFVLLNMSHSSSKIRPYFLLFKPSYLYIFISLILALMSIFFGIFCLNYVLSVRTVSVISLLKFFPQVLLISFLVGRIFLFQLNFITSKNFIILFSSILYLHLFLNTVFKKVFLIRLFYLFKSLEHGIFYNLINSSIWLVSRKLNIFFIKRITIS